MLTVHLVNDGGSISSRLVGMSVQLVSRLLAVRSQHEGPPLAKTVEWLDGDPIA